MNYIVEGTEVTLKKDYKNLPKGSKGFVESRESINWFVINYDGQLITTPSEYLDKISPDSIVITPEESNIYNSAFHFIDTLEDLSFKYAGNPDFDIDDKETWPLFFKGLDAAYGDIMKRITSAIKESHSVKD